MGKLPAFFSKNEDKTPLLFKDNDATLDRNNMRKTYISRPLGVFLVAFTLFFSLFFFLTQSDFKKDHPISSISRLMKNSLVTFEKNPLIRHIGALVGVQAKNDEMADYKLNLVSKSLDSYFKNLLIETQEAISKKELATAFSPNKKYLNLSKAKFILKEYLRKNRDVLSFSVHDLQLKQIIGMKYAEIEKYSMQPKFAQLLSDKNNLLLRHKGSENLVLFSKIFFKEKPLFYVVQTLHPLFFSRILTHLEITDEIFYIRDEQNFVVLDNFDVVRWQEQQSAEKQAEEGSFFNVYENLIVREEQSVSLNFEEVSYSLGMVVVKNSLLGNVFVVAVMALLFAFCFFLATQLFFFFYAKKD